MVWVVVMCKIFRPPNFPAKTKKTTTLVHGFGRSSITIEHTYKLSGSISTIVNIVSGIETKVQHQKADGREGRTTKFREPGCYQSTNQQRRAMNLWDLEIGTKHWLVTLVSSTAFEQGKRRESRLGSWGAAPYDSLNRYADTKCASPPKYRACRY